MFYRKILSACLFLAVCNSLAAARDLAVVSNKANSLSTISPPDLVKVSKAQTNHWPDGKPVTLIRRSTSTPEMKLFLEKVYELPEAQVKELIATANHGRANHPAIMIVDSVEEPAPLRANPPAASRVSPAAFRAS